MELKKIRLELFSDAVMAIIITLIAIEIPAPKNVDLANLSPLLKDISVYFLSFIVVGSFWSQHYRVFHLIENVNKKVIGANMLLLFFLSLIPLFTKMVMEHPEALLPAIGFNSLFLLAQFCYMVILKCALEEGRTEEVKRLQKMRENHGKPKSNWVHFSIFIIIIGGSISLARSTHDFSAYFLLWLPVIASVLNLFFEDKRRRRRE